MLRSGNKIQLLGLSTEELKSLAVSLGEKQFRGRQLAAWIYRKNVSHIEEMTDLPSKLRQKMIESCALYRAQAVAVDKASEGTTKALLKMEDNQQVEAVLLPYTNRNSVCVSTQIGCPAGCIFCATAIDGFARNLAAGEIVDEVLTIQKLTPERISHVVYMGMGEPLLNYENVIKSIHLLNKEVGISMRSITISTVGITPMIEQLAKEKLQLTLAISIHAPNDRLRRRIMPIASRYPISELLSTCKKYIDLTNRRITFEYLLIKGINDSLANAHELASLLKGLLCNVNLIPYNAVESLQMNRPTQSRVRAFRAVLEKAGIIVTQRFERGHVISGACGQLRRRMGK